jgi:hypothetical protein
VPFSSTARCGPGLGRAGVLEIEGQGPSLKTQQQIVLEPMLERIFTAAVFKFGNTLLNLSEAENTDIQSGFVNIGNPRDHTGIRLWFA